MQKRKRINKDGRPVPLRYRKQSKRKILEPHLESPKGIKVRSKLELKCIEIFDKYGIEFQYEPLMLLRGRQLRPDFYLPDYNLFFEICGLRHMPYYDEKYIGKEKVYENSKLDVIIIDADTVKSVELKLLKSLKERKILV